MTHLLGLNNLLDGVDETSPECIGLIFCDVRAPAEPSPALHSTFWRRISSYIYSECCVLYEPSTEEEIRLYEGFHRAVLAVSRAERAPKISGDAIPWTAEGWEHSGGWNTHQVAPHFGNRADEAAEVDRTTGLSGPTPWLRRGQPVSPASAVDLGENHPSV